MAEIMKKKRNEIIKKINVKSYCRCYLSGGCSPCSCAEIRGKETKYPSATALGQIDAEECAKEYYHQSEVHPYG